MESVDVIMIYGIIVSGLILPYSILSDIMVVGIIVTDAVFITNRVIILLEAVSLFLFNT